MIGPQGLPSQPRCIRTVGAFTLSVTDYAGGTELPWHLHEQTYVTFVARGTFRQLLRRETRQCGTRALIVHGAGEVHADRFGRDDARCMKIEFETAWLRALIGRGSFFERPTIVQATNIVAVADRMVRELIDGDDHSPLMLEGLALELIAELHRQQDSSSTRVPSWLKEVHATVSERFHEPLPLSDLAAAVDIHPTHLVRAFRRHYGRTIGDFVRDLRVEHAKNRIAAGAALSDVALDCGFADQSHFARTFRRLAGVTPTEYRRAC
ncbi:MAG TPA: helix-turn-helix transcriptional regulator [Thermoanaerobaculia bacterium]|nr:helix-turn-helix transcriptional regulator [Thermoanaerobaculia bacterium]